MPQLTRYSESQCLKAIPLCCLLHWHNSYDYNLSIWRTLPLPPQLLLYYSWFNWSFFYNHSVGSSPKKTIGVWWNRTCYRLGALHITQPTVSSHCSTCDKITCKPVSGQHWTIAVSLAKGRHNVRTNTVLHSNIYT